MASGGGLPRRRILRRHRAGSGGGGGDGCAGAGGDGKTFGSDWSRWASVEWRSSIASLMHGVAHGPVNPWGKRVCLSRLQLDCDVYVHFREKKLCNKNGEQTPFSLFYLKEKNRHYFLQVNLTTPIYCRRWACGVSTLHSTSKICLAALTENMRDRLVSSQRRLLRCCFTWTEIMRTMADGGRVSSARSAADYIRTSEHPQQIHTATYRS
jgi:hypothetical protein